MTQTAEDRYAREQMMIYKSLLRDLEQRFPELASVDYSADHPCAATLQRLRTYRESIKALQGFAAQRDEGSERPAP